MLQQREAIAGHRQLIAERPGIGNGHFVIVRRPVGLLPVGRIEDGGLALHDVADRGLDAVGILAGAGNVGHVAMIGSIPLLIALRARGAYRSASGATLARRCGLPGQAHAAACVATPGHLSRTRASVVMTARTSLLVKKASRSRRILASA